MASWLRAPDPSSNHKSARQTRHRGTGEWLLNDTRFQDWKTKSASLLWLCGPPGCGKTVLSSTVIDNIRSNSSKECMVIYFYFDFNDAKKWTLNNLLRSLIQQVSAESGPFELCVEALWRSCADGRRQPTTEQLYQCLVQLVGQTGQTCIVLDALDESTTRIGSYTEGILPCFKRLMQNAKEPLHLLVTSRTQRDIEEFFDDWTGVKSMISLQSSLIHQDIESYIDHQLRSSGRFDQWQQRTEILDKIRSTLVVQANAVYV